ncbi:IS1634 family transposase [Alicyclobacillus curvatus]|nr:IS1634 family transposase [Alicyclobacillus curvatus]
MLDDLKFTAKKLGSGPIWSWMIDRLGWVSKVDELVEVAPEDCRVSVGERTKALLVNILTDRKALYKVQEFYDEYDVQSLVGPNVTADALNDDALGRALDAIHEAGIDGVLSMASFSALDFASVPLDRLHGDTTSMSFYGHYRQHRSAPDDEEGSRLEITRGYSKDHRPDLKQVIFGMVTAHGIPLLASPENGNLDDKTWNAQTIAKLAESLPKQKLSQIFYIADSAAVTSKNLPLFHEHGIRFISRLPNTFAMCDKVKRSALEKNRWEDVGRLGERQDAATYRIQSFYREMDGLRYRFIAVQSSALDERKRKRLEKLIETEYKDFAKVAAEESERAYSCLADAERAAAELSKSFKGYHTIEIQTNEEMEVLKRLTRGRPRKDAPAPTRKVFRNIVTIHEPSPEALEEARRVASMFVLITNVLDEQTMSNLEVLQAYKEQIEVEYRFRFLKSPYFVGPVYLQNPDRVEALGCLMLMAVILYATFEYMIRVQMVKESEPLILPGKRKSMRPTGLSMLEMFNGLAMVLIHLDERIIRKGPQVDGQRERILNMLGAGTSVYSDMNKRA